MTTKPAQPSSVLVIGVGNAYRSDDAAGLIVARSLGQVAPMGVTVVEASGEGLNLMESWRAGKVVILIDAVRSGAEPGFVRRFDAQEGPIPAQCFRCSSHTFGVAEAIELSRVLDQLPVKLILYGIEGKQFDPGVGLSAEVDKAVQEVVERVVRDVQVYLQAEVRHERSSMD